MSTVSKILLQIWRITLLAGLLLSVLQQSYFILTSSFIFQYSLLTSNFIISLVLLFKKDLRLQRVGYFLISVLVIALMYKGFLDLKYYLSGDIKEIKGVPNELVYSSITNGPDYYYLEINNIDFAMPLIDMDENLKNKCFHIMYLPHSKYIIDYNILPINECKE